MSATYARMLRAWHRGEGIRLTAEEIGEFVHDDALIMAALGGDGSDGDVPEWLTPTERARLAAGDSGYLDVFRPGRDVRDRE